MAISNLAGGKSCISIKFWPLSSYLSIEWMEFDSSYVQSQVQFLGWPLAICPLTIALRGPQLKNSNLQVFCSNKCHMHCWSQDYFFCWVDAYYVVELLITIWIVYTRIIPQEDVFRKNFMDVEDTIMSTTVLTISLSYNHMVI